MWGIRPGTNAQLRKEFRAQIERFSQGVGRPPDHLDNHCSVSYIRPDRFKVTLELAQEFALPIRAPFGDDLEDQIHGIALHTQKPSWLVSWLGNSYRRRVDRIGILRPNAFIQEFYFKGIRTPEHLLGILDSLKDGWITELLVHPAYDGDWKEEDLRALRDPRVRKRLDEPDIELVSFSSLAK